MMAGRRVARRRPASFVQQLDGSGGGGGLLLARRHKSVVVAKIGGGVLKDSSSSSSSSSSSLESLFESQSGAFCPFFGGGEIPLFIPFLSLFFPFFSLFFCQKRIFFASFFFGQNHSTKKRTTQNRIFGHTQSTNVLVVVRSRVVRKPLENDFSETKGNDDQKKAPTACT